MCVVDKPPKIIRRPVDMRRRKPVHTLITPSIAAGGLNPRHNLSDRDPQFRQARKFLHCAGPGPFPCEGTDVQLIDDLIIDRNSRPVRILPWKSAGIDNLRGAVNTLRLKARGRVGKRPVSVETIGIPAANSSLFDTGGEIAGGLGCQRKRTSACSRSGAQTRKCAPPPTASAPIGNRRCTFSERRISGGGAGSFLPFLTAGANTAAPENFLLRHQPVV